MNAKKELKNKLQKPFLIATTYQGDNGDSVIFDSFKEELQTIYKVTKISGVWEGVKERSLIIQDSMGRNFENLIPRFFNEFNQDAVIYSIGKRIELVSPSSFETLVENKFNKPFKEGEGKFGYSIYKGFKFHF